MLSFTKATAQPPHPAPVSLAPRAPLLRQIFTSSSNSGQLIPLIKNINSAYKGNYILQGSMLHSAIFKVGKAHMTNHAL